MNLLEQAQSLMAGGDLAGGSALAQQALQRDPGSGLAHLLLAMAAVMQGQAEAALDHARQAVAASPADARAHNVLGRALKLANRLPEAALAYRQAIALQPDYAEAHVSLGIALKHAGDLPAALQSYERAVALNPLLAAARANLAYARAAMAAQMAEAGADQAPDETVLAEARRAAELEPRHAQLHFNLGLLLRRAQRRSEAIDAFNLALGAEPARVDCCLHLGHELAAVGATRSAIAVYESWLQRNPPNPTVMRALANLLAREGDAGPALAWAEKAVALDADPWAWLQLCHSYQQCRRLPESLHAGRLAIAMSGGRWDMYAVPLLVASYLLEDSQPIADLHAEFGAALALSLPAPQPSLRRTRAPGQRLRLGYLSADFIDHSVAFFISPLLEHHDRERFEVWCYHNRGYGDDMTERLRGHADQWVECEHLSDEALAQRVRADAIDVLVDLSGHTQGGRMRVFGLGAAPLQLSYLGYPTATGVRGMHHRLSDPVIDPGDMPDIGSDRPLCLPRSMFCYRPPESPAVTPEPPSLRGTPTFGSFNNLAKLSDHTLTLWARVLQAVPGSRLLVKAGAGGDEGNRRNIEAFMARHGVAASRLEMRTRVGDRSGHLGLYNEVDVALDSFPYNGATTTCEALWMGVPVVSLAGRTHTSRMGASILGAAGRAQWVGRSDDAFVALAAALAQDEAQRAHWRRHARTGLRASALMDEPGFVAAFEQVLLQAWAGRLAGEAPE